MGQTLVFLHGFTHTHHHWHAPARIIADALDEGHRHRFVDLPGHGLSASERTSISDPATAAALAALGGAGMWVGYSMGARFALHAALAPLHQIQQLVLIGATPGIDDDQERAERRTLDEHRAASIETDGVDVFLDAWLAMPMFARLPVDDDGLAQRRRNTAAGLASSLRLAGTGSQTSLWGRLGEIEMPVLLLAGELDTKFVEIGQRMAALLPDATFTAIADAGHAAHAEQPAAVADAIRSWRVAQR
jgi:2-succinyl-6-hydroxy-2,4-cyclohexadiene-1-carboxylate synthase